MNQTQNIKITNGTVIVTRTKRANAKCIKCGARFHSAAASLGFEGVTCMECKARKQ